MWYPVKNGQMNEWLKHVVPGEEWPNERMAHAESEPEELVVDFGIRRHAHGRADGRALSAAGVRACKAPARADGGGVADSGKAEREHHDSDA